MAERELAMYETWNNGEYQPMMKASKVLGSSNEDGQPCEPVYAIGKVTERGANLPGKSVFFKIMQTILMILGTMRLWGILRTIQSCSLRCVMLLLVRLPHTS